MLSQQLFIALMSLALVSCAESIHQRDRMGFEQGPSPTFEAPAISYLNESQLPPPVSEKAPGHIQLAQGQAVTLSGLVLKAKRLDGFTEIEILQLPTGADGKPTEDRRQSQGRFLARQTSFLDPAILATKPLVTVNGVVEGEVDRALEIGSDNYAYAVVTIQDLTIWPHELLHPYTGSLSSAGSATTLSQPGDQLDFISNFLGAFFSGLGQTLFGHNRRDYRSRYNNSYYSSPSSSSSSPSPSPPPEKDIPPQFKKRH